MKITKSPLRIAVIVRLFPNIVQTYALNHIISLINAGHDVLIIAERDPKQKEIHPAIQKYHLLDKTLYIDPELGKLTKQLASIPLNNRQYLSALKIIFFSGIWKHFGFKYGLKAIIGAKALALSNIDLIHAHSLFGSYHYLFLREYFSIPIITTFHGLVPKNVKMLETKKIRAALDTGDAFFVNTQFAKNQLVSLGCVHEKIHIIPQSTNITDFPFSLRSIPDKEKIVIISVGRLSVEKGFHIAIKAIARLKDHFQHIEYRIIGGGIEENNLIKLVQSLDLINNVKLLGPVSTDELLSHYTDAHIFILPSIDFRDGSHTETQGVVLQEAQASGIPVIASKTGGIPEVIKDGRTGLLFDEENDEQLAHRIESLIMDSTLYNSISLQARKDVENNFSIVTIYNQQLAVYNSILGNP